MSSETLALIGMAYRFRKRISTSFPYWLRQNTEIHVGMTKDPDHTRKALFKLAIDFPHKIHIHNFKCHPFNRSELIRGMLKRVKTRVSACVDFDLIPPPGFVEKVVSMVTDTKAVSAARVDLQIPYAEELLGQSSKEHHEIMSDDRARGYRIEGRNYYGYFQAATTKNLRKCFPDKEHIGTNHHDVWLRENLKKAKIEIIGLEDNLIHLDHPRFVRENTGTNL
jgi:hypothetical protein